jgi:hypothetical protein
MVFPMQICCEIAVMVTIIFRGQTDNRVIDISKKHLFLFKC